MAASIITTPEHNNRTAAGTDRPQSTKHQHRRRLLSHLHIQVPVPASSGWSGRPSGPASAPCGAAHAASAHHHHQDHRPASPSLLRSPTAWIRSKGRHGFGSSKHTTRRPGNFHYDARSYAQNFDDGGRDEDDALTHRCCLSPGLVASPRQVSPSVLMSQGTSGSGGGGGSSDGEETARETLRAMD